MTDALGLDGAWVRVRSPTGKSCTSFSNSYPLHAKCPGDRLSVRHKLFWIFCGGSGKGQYNTGESQREATPPGFVA